MKLSGPAAARFAAQPDAKLCGALIWGDDEAEVAARKDRLRIALVGKGEEADLCLSRIEPGDLRREPALLLDAVKARGFFGGRRAALVEAATDGLAPAFEAALAAAGPEDAFIIATAGKLPARSKLRALFEAARNAVSAPVYSDGAGPERLRALLAEAGIGAAEDQALAALETVAAGMDTGGLRDLVNRLALYRLDDPGPLREADVRACAPGALGAETDAVIDAVLLRNAAAIGPLLARIAAQGEGAVSVVLAASRRFAQVHGAETGAGGRPLFGAAKEVAERAKRLWTLEEVEAALRSLLETDLALRGPAGAAPFAVLERSLVRLALARIKARRSG